MPVIFTDNSVVIARGWRWGHGEKGKGGLTWDGKHTMQCTNDVLWNYAPETCIIVLTSATPQNSMKRKKMGQGI